MKSLTSQLLLIGLSLGLVLQASSVGARSLTGAGATFPAPAYAKWAEACNKLTQCRINCQAIGSSGGIRQIDGKTVVYK